MTIQIWMMDWAEVLEHAESSHNYVTMMILSQLDGSVDLQRLAQLSWSEPLIIRDKMELKFNFNP